METKTKVNDYNKLQTPVLSPEGSWTGRFLHVGLKASLDGGVRVIWMNFLVHSLNDSGDITGCELCEWPTQQLVRRLSLYIAIVVISLKFI